MKRYISEEEAIYQDNYHGQFSKKLATWAVSNMGVKEPETGGLRHIRIKPIDEVSNILRACGVNIPNECIYTAYYLYHMAIADYPKSFTTDKQRAVYIEETIGDPDGDKGDVLSCFVAKMCNAGVPIYWELYI